MPVVVVTAPAAAPTTAPPVAAIVARPAAAQGELNVTVTGAPEKSVPVWSTIEASTLVEPPADRVVEVIPSMPAAKELPLLLPIENVGVVDPPVPPVPPPVRVPPEPEPVPPNALLLLPPHAAKPSASVAKTVIDANFLMSHPTL